MWFCFCFVLFSNSSNLCSGQFNFKDVNIVCVNLLTIQLKSICFTTFPIIILNGNNQFKTGYFRCELSIPESFIYTQTKITFIIIIVCVCVLFFIIWQVIQCLNQYNNHIQSVNVCRRHKQRKKLVKLFFFLNLI